MPDSKYPAVLDPSLVGTYPAEAFAGGGYLWDEVLEYRVWCHPEQGAPDDFDGNDYFHYFDTGEEALEFSSLTEGAEEPLALILQRKYIDEPKPGGYIHEKTKRINEWPLKFLSRPKRQEHTIGNFFVPRRSGKPPRYYTGAIRLILTIPIRPPASRTIQ